MTKKDYINLARVLGEAFRDIEHPEYSPELVLEALMANIIKILEADNPRFDRDRFLEAVSGSSLALK
jgi:hypothetical protein